MKPKVYIETSVVSYLTSAPSRDLVVAAHQQLTREWWQQRERFDLFVSEAVHQEAARGQHDAAARRTAILQGISSLSLDTAVIDLARQLLEANALPEAARGDAFHVAIAAVNGMDYLLTWNCRHIANRFIRARIDHVCRRTGHTPPIRCTPEEL